MIGFSAGAIAVVTAKADRIRDRLAGIVKGVRSWSEAAR